MQNLNEKETGNFIRELRKQAGLTQKELGGKIGISDKAISKWERGLSFPDITLLPRLAETFQVSVGEIISGRHLMPQEVSTETLETVVSQTLEYSRRDTFRWRRLVLNLIVILAALAAAICVIVNLAVSGRIDWAWYPLGAILMLVCWIGALVIPVRHRLETIMAVLGISILLYLFMIEQLSGASGWFFPLAMPITLVTVVSLTLILKLIQRLKRRWLALCFGCLLLAAGPLISVSQILRFNGIQPQYDLTRMTAVPVLLAAAGLFYLLDRNRPQN